MKKFEPEKISTEARNFSGEEALRLVMNRIPAKYARVVGIMLASAAFLWALAFTAVDARTPTSGEASAIAMLADNHTQTATRTSAERQFPGAPDGVDPVVTGPVSAQLRERQKAFDCDKAVWPNIPLACYPD
jgi:hypothetical protein